jgi:hypothetical protein
LEQAWPGWSRTGTDRTAPNLAGGSITKICSSKPIGTTVLQALGVACLGQGPLISWFGSDRPLLKVPFR